MKHVELSKTGFQGRSHDDHEHLKIHRLNKSPTDKSHYLVATIIEITVGVPVPAYSHGPTVVYVIEGTLNLFRSMVTCPIIKNRIA